MDDNIADNGDLIYGIKSRNKDAFVRLFDQYYDNLHTFAKSIVISSDIADDIVQDVFLKLWDCAFELNITSSLKAYLYTMVRNRSLNSLRNLHINYTNQEIENDLIQVEDYKDCIVELNSFHSLVNNILEFLPIQSRIIVRHRVFDGYKYKEIANELNISEANCKMIMKRAIEKIKKKHPNMRGLWLLEAFI